MTTTTALKTGRVNADSKNYIIAEVKAGVLLQSRITTEAEGLKRIWAARRIARRLGIQLASFCDI